MRKRTAFLPAVLAVLAALALCAAAAEEPAEPVFLTGFDCEDLEGNPVDTALFDGAELVLIDCWEAWCPWCLKEMPDLDELYRLNKDSGLLIVGLSGISAAPGYDAKQTAGEMNISYPLVSGTAELLPCAPACFPTTYVYQRQEDGSLLFLGHIEGYMPREDRNAFLEEYLPGAVTEGVPAESL